MNSQKPKINPLKVTTGLWKLPYCSITLNTVSEMDITILLNCLSCMLLENRTYMLHLIQVNFKLKITKYYHLTFAHIYFYHLFLIMFVSSFTTALFPPSFLPDRLSLHLKPHFLDWTQGCKT